MAPGSDSIRASLPVGNVPGARALGIIIIIITIIIIMIIIISSSSITIVTIIIIIYYCYYYYYYYYYYNDYYSSRRPCGGLRQTPRRLAHGVRPISLLRLSLLRSLDSNFLGNPLWAWEFHPLKITLCFSQAL